MDISRDQIVAVHVDCGDNGDGPGVCDYVSQNHTIINLLDVNID